MIFSGLFASCYPRVLPIRKTFKLAACSHLAPGAPRAKIAKDAGFDFLSVDVLSDLELEALKRDLESTPLSALALAAKALQPLDVTYAKKVEAIPNVAYLLTANEPNSPRFWNEGVLNLVEDYRRLRAAVSKPIIGGNLADISSCEPEEWIKDLREYGADKLIDVIGIHQYSSHGKPTVERIEQLMRLYRQAGFRQPFWITEFGFRNGSYEKRARWLVWVLSQMSRKLDVLGASVYELSNATDWSLLDFPNDAPRGPAMARIKEARG